MIGAGNVSAHISRHLHSAGQRISCVYSRTEKSARTLADELGVPGTSTIEEVPGEADFYIMALPDSVLAAVSGKFRHTRGIWLHTAGAVPMAIFRGIFDRYGVLYPLQTLSRSRPVEPSRVPMLLEGSTALVTGEIRSLALKAYSRVEEVDSDTRLVIHAAAVFANNFTSQMVHIAKELLAGQTIDPGLLDPLLGETFEKIKALGTLKGRTGPAIRGDYATMNRHIELLKDHPEWEKIYTFISRDIEKLRE